MSKRFGRKQRRRAREALAAAASEAERFKAAHEMTSGLLSSVSESKRTLEQEIQEAKEMAGPYSALFSPPTAKVRYEVHADTRYRVAPVKECAPISMCDFESIAEAETMTVIDLPAMLASVRKDSMADMVHAMVEYQGGRWAYHIDRRTLLSMGKTRAVQEVSKYLAMAICNELFGPRRAAA